jgi:hypothetical protein
MALTSTEKKEIEVIVRKEMKDFLGSNTMKQFEEKMLELIIKELKRGKVGSEVKDIVVKIFSEFYQFMWMQRSYWEPRLKNVR